MSRSPMSAVLAVGLAVASALAAGPTAAQSGETGPPYRSLFDRGATYGAFQHDARGRRELWERNSAAAAVPAALVARARPAVAEPGRGPWRLLVVASDRCSDSVNTIPWVAALADSVGVALRVVDPDAGRAVMEAHTLPDGRSATPTVVLLDGAYRPIGAWVERPAALVSFLADPVRAGLSHDARFDAKMAWYARDAGRATLVELVELMEGASRAGGAGGAAGIDAASSRSG